MDEQEKKEMGKEETTTTKDDGDKSQTVKETERIRAETDRLNKAIAEKENADARAKIGGVTAGNAAPDKPKERTPAEELAFHRANNWGVKGPEVTPE